MSKPTRPQPPPVYRPQPTPKVLQPKAANAPARQTSAAPTIYRPGPLPKVVQAKTPAAPSAAVQRPAAPTGYHPQPSPKVLQSRPQAPVQLKKAAQPQRPLAPCGCGQDAPAKAAAPAGKLGQGRPSLQAGAAARVGSANLTAGTIQRTKKKNKTKSGGMSKAERSWRNLTCYNKDKAKRVVNEHGNHYLTVMENFVAYYSNGIRGHCSKDGNSKPNQATKDDLRAFNSWYG